MSSYQPVASVLRSFEILRILNTRTVSTIAQIRKSSGLPNPTVVRMLETLIRAGYVTKAEGRGYRVTSQVSTLSRGFYHKRPEVETGRPWARELTRVHQWPIAIAILDLSQFGSVSLNGITAIKENNLGTQTQ